MKYKIPELKKILIFSLLLMFFLTLYSVIAIAVLFHSSYTGFKEMWVTTAMSTMEHQYLAKMLVSDEEIAEIMESNKVIQVGMNAKTSDIRIKKEADSSIEKIDIRGKGYKGIMLVIPDPSRVFIGSAKADQAKGMFLKDIVKKYDAVAGINAGGFVNQSSKHGDSREADGLLISEGVILKGVDDLEYNVIGFTKDDKFILGVYELPKIKKLKIRDAVSFAPFLIVNGNPSKIIGNGGWGINPRTAIGQRKDGTVLLLAIDGRQTGSVGATISQVQDIMIEYGAYNATNLDGGSSTIMVYKDEIVNNPCSVATGRFLPDAFLVRK
ncbi:MAG TPA: exopolysaccharide biosynthesis protein [Clostridiales bacterium]|nr:exopolysaccharide biosynthesis protein [Clostridiales bacterium]